MIDAAMAVRLRRAREAAGYERPTDALRAFGWNRSTYFGHENGHRGISRDRLMIYAEAFHVARDWLASGRGPMRGGRGPRIISIEGVVDDLAVKERLEGQELGETEVPEGISPEDFVAYIIGGERNYPAWQEHDVILTLRNHGPPEDYIGRRCLVRLKEHSELLIRTLANGTRAGVFILMSHVAPPMIDVEILEAAPIIWTKHG